MEKRRKLRTPSEIKWRTMQNTKEQHRQHNQKSNRGQISKLRKPRQPKKFKQKTNRKTKKIKNAIGNQMENDIEHEGTTPKK